MRMTTVLEVPIRADSPFDHTRIRSSYHDIATLETSIGHTGIHDPKPTYIHAEYDRQYVSSVPSSAPSSPTYTHFSRDDPGDVTPASSLLDQVDALDGDQDDDDDDDMAFPSYDHSTAQHKPTFTPEPEQDQQRRGSISTPITEDAASLPDAVNDDHAIEHEPTRHVDYLSHEWREEDIWSSWRYIVARRKQISNSVRLENAAWRTWVKAKYDLSTVSPETLNWLKDCDVTWLYGPLQTDTKKSLINAHCQPSNGLSTSSSFLCKKPILKKKSASAAILERSRSQHSLLQRASEIIRQQQASPAMGRPLLRRGDSDFPVSSYSPSSVANTPAGHDTPSTSSHRFSFAWPEAQTPLDQKHVLFDETVRQVQAIETEEDDKDLEPASALAESDEDDDGGLIMAPTRSRDSTRDTPRGSFSSESKTIAPLPSTKLKKGRTNTPEPPSQTSSLPIWSSNRRLSPSASQETLRPARLNHNFLIDDDPELNDEPWATQGGSTYSPFVDEDQPTTAMRRTESGMFMPYDENEEEAAMNNTLFGQAVYAVNTFKDIAHVVWNVGWNRK